MRALLLSLVVSAAAATSAVAQPVLSAGQLGCAETRALVDANRVVILETAPGVYDRVVSSQMYCDPHEETRPRFTATADSAECFVGRECVTRIENLFPR